MTKGLMGSNYEINQRSRENLILLVLGSSSKRISFLHLEKETFLLWKFHPDIGHFIEFNKHFRGPYSNDIKASIENPMYCISCWTFTPPLNNDKLTGGYVRITEHGKKEYQRIAEAAQETSQLTSLLSAIKMVRKLYDKLSPEELLLLIYDTYPEYIERSEVYKEIFRKRDMLAHHMYDRGVIDRKRLDSLISK